MKPLAIAVMLSFGLTAKALQPGDVILNEVRFNGKGEAPNNFEAVELLVVGDKVDLNSLQISDRNEWNTATEEQCTLNDLGKGFLTEVRSGTLIVVYDGKGEDDTDATDFTLTFYVKSSLFCNAAPTGKGFALHNEADNIHLLYNGGQLDFVKYSIQEKPRKFSGDPGKLKWEGGMEGYVDISPAQSGIAGFRFVGDSPELNDYPTTWRTYQHFEDDNLGKPNGSRNTEWINLLRAKSKYDQSASSAKPVPPHSQ